MNQQALRHVLRELGELVEHVGNGAAATDLAAYAGRPIAFAKEVLGLRLLRWQRAWLDAFHAHRQHVVWSCNGAGKTAVLAALLIYVAAVIGGTVVYFSATERQTRSQMGSTLKRYVGRAAALNADVYTYGAVFSHGGTVYFATAGDISAMQGHHGADLLVVADEAQALEDEQLAALQGCTVGEQNTLVLAGNPLVFGGPLHKVATSTDPSWHRRKVTAFEVVADPEHPHIPGLISKRAIDDLRQSWGEEGAIFQSRAHANFPTTPSDPFFSSEAIAAAFARHADPAFIARTNRLRLSLGLDVGASSDGDESVWSQPEAVGCGS